MFPILAEYIYIYYDILYQNVLLMPKKMICKFKKQVSNLNSYLKKKNFLRYAVSEIRKYPYFVFNFRVFKYTDAFCWKTNLTSRIKILTGERQCDEFLFNGSPVARRKLGPELWTFMLTLPPVKNADYT